LKHLDPQDGAHRALPQLSPRVTALARRHRAKRAIAQRFRASAASRDTTHETLSALIARHPGLKSHFKFALLPRMNASRHEHYAGYYDSWCRDFVAARYGRDIAEFGYTFGEG
jgi:hypothetical protein